MVFTLVSTHSSFITYQIKANKTAHSRRILQGQIRVKLLFFFVSVGGTTQLVGS